MIVVLVALVALNLLLTSGVVVSLVWGKQLKEWAAKHRRSTLKPIRHKPLESPKIPMVIRQGGPIGAQVTTSYYRPKGQPDADPFIATFYPEPSVADGVMFRDTYVDDQGSHTAGRIFRLAFEPAEVAQVVDLSRSVQPARPARSNRTVLKPTKSGEMIRGIPASR